MVRLKALPYNFNAAIIAVFQFLMVRLKVIMLFAI